MKVSGTRRHGRKGIGTVLATIIFVFIVIFMTANLIVWGIVQQADLQGVINTMTQRDQQQGAEKISVPSALFGGTNKYSSCVAGTGTGCGSAIASTTGASTTSLVSNMNFTTSTTGWAFTKILAPGTSSGITGGYDAGGTEVGAVGSPSGPGMIYMGVSAFPASGTSTYSATWSNRFYVDLSQFGIKTGEGFNNYPSCSGPACYIVGSWAWILPRVNPGVIALTVKMEIADSSATGTSCSPPHCYTLDQQIYTTLADQTWNYRKATWGAFTTTGTVHAVGTNGTLPTITVSTPAGWFSDEWKNYFVTMTSGSCVGDSRAILDSTSDSQASPDTFTVDSAWSGTGCSAPAVGDTFTISLSFTDKASASTCTSTPCSSLIDTSAQWDSASNSGNGQWAGSYLSIVAGTGTGQTEVITSNTAQTLNLQTAWTTPPDSTSQFLIGCPANTFCDWDVRTSTLLNEISTTYSPAFWGVAGTPGFYTIQVESDFTLSQSTNPSEVRIIFDDTGLAFRTPSSFASSGGALSGTVINLPLTNGENPALIQQLTVSTATAFSIANVQEASYIKDYATGNYDPLSSGFVSQATVNTTTIFTGSSISNYIGTQTSSTLLNQPAGVVVQGGALWVSDAHNNRILEYTSLSSNGPAAALEIGQPAGASAFTTSASGTSSTGLNNPQGIAFDTSGNLWVADSGNNRVLLFCKQSAVGMCSGSTGFQNGEAASLVIGQASFTASSSATTSTGFTDPTGVAFDSAGNLWVADTGNNRVLEFKTSFSTGEIASMVIGQQSYSVSSPTPDGGQIGTLPCAPCTTVTDTSGSKAWVPGEWAGGSVTVTSSDGTKTQTRTILNNTANSFTVSTAFSSPNPDNTYTYALTSATVTDANLNAPSRIFFPTGSSTNLWVVDSGDNRILEFYPAPTAESGCSSSTALCSGMRALLEIGQASGTAQYGTAGSATSATGLSGPTGVFLDSAGNLWVADTGNNRVLKFVPGTSPCAASKLCSGMPASNPTVVGQTALTSNTAATTQSGLNSPSGLYIDSSVNLWVADKINDRVLEYTSGSLTASGPNAAFEAGQPGTTNTQWYNTAAHPNIQLLISATDPSSFSVKTMAASVQDFFKNPNSITIQVANNWASTSHIVDVFVIDSTGTHCFTRVPSACAASLLPSVGATALTSSGTVSGTTLTDSGGGGSWTSSWANYPALNYNFAYIVSGAGAGSYGIISSNAANSLTVSSWVNGPSGGPSGSISYFIGQTWSGIYVAPGSTGVITIPFTWTTGTVTIKVTTDLGNTVVLNTIAS